MKEFWKSGVIILLIIGVLYILYLRECKREVCPPEGMILVGRSEWDSIFALANKPPVVRIDTFWKERPVVTPKPQPPLPNPQPFEDIGSIISDSNNEDIHLYRDSLIRTDINVWVDYIIEGTLLSRDFRYKPIVKEIRIDSVIYVPKLVTVEKVVEKAANGLFLYATAGGNSNSFLFGGGVDYITKKNTELGYMYQRYGNVNFHSVKVGVKIKLSR